MTNAEFPVTGRDVCEFAWIVFMKVLVSLLALGLWVCFCKLTCVVFICVLVSLLALCLWVCLRVCLHCVYVCLCEFACIVFMSSLTLLVFASSPACGKGGKLPAPHIGASVHSFWSRLGSNYCKRQFMMLSNWIGYEYTAALLIPSHNELWSPNSVHSFKAAWSKFIWHLHQ